MIDISDQNFAVELMKFNIWMKRVPNAGLISQPGDLQPSMLSLCHSCLE